MSLVHKIESCLPANWVEFWRFYKKYRLKQRQYSCKEKQLCQTDKPINVVFFAISASAWKYESVYRLMEQDSMFNPLVLICPVDNQGEEFKHKRMEECYTFFTSNGYKTMMAYDGATDTYIDAHDLHPDIIFYTNPYRYLIDDRYFIDKFSDVLTVYVDYTYETSNEKWPYSLPVQQLAWRWYVPTVAHQKMINMSNPIHLANTRVTGYTPYDSFVEYQTKHSHTQRPKTIIWAPHHSIFPSKYEYDVRWSTFLLNADMMLSLAQSHPEMHFIFRPHPLLKVALYKHSDWGKERTDAYYRLWETMPNTEFSSGDYVAQFCESDALIHDCGSFIAEYLYTRKPCLYVSNYMKQYIEENKLNQVGLDAWNAHYHAYSEGDIKSFIEDVVLNGQDSKKQDREDFFSKYLLPPNDISVAENIVKDIKESCLLCSRN